MAKSSIHIAIHSEEGCAYVERRFHIFLDESYKDKADQALSEIKSILQKTSKGFRNVLIDVDHHTSEPSFKTEHKYRYAMKGGYNDGIHVEYLRYESRNNMYSSDDDYQVFNESGKAVKFIMGALTREYETQKFLAELEIKDEKEAAQM